MNEREIFTEALNRTDPADRAAFLDAACAGDPALRRRVAELLGFDASANDLLDRHPASLLGALGGATGPADSPPGGTPSESLVRQLAPYLEPPGRPDSLGRLGHYEVLDVLGQGGHGIVVKAFDASLHRAVAVKALAPHLAESPAPRARFLREARAAARVRHDHVVQIYAVEEHPLPHLVMEFVEGPTLQQRLDAAGPLPPADAARLARQVALGLAAAHAEGLIHRDIKPANVLLEAGPEPRARLTDFGLARASDDAGLTQTGVIVGTPLYMAPEQARGEPVDHRADLFSLGSVLYALVSGRPPFRAPSTLAVLKRVAEDAPRPIHEVVAGVPPGLAAVITRLLRKRPQDRYASAAEAADALATCLDRPARPAWHTRAWAAAGVGVPLLVGLAWIARGPSPPPHAPEGPSRPPPDAPVPAPVVAPSPSPTAAPADAWSARVARLTPAEQVRAVHARLKDRNPAFDDPQISAEYADGVVVALYLHHTEHLADLTPLAVLTGLKRLHLYAAPADPPRGVVSLAGLAGLALEELVSYDNPIADLSPLADMPLQYLRLWRAAATDLSPLRGKRLVDLNVGGGGVTDLAPLRGMPIETLCVARSPVADLSPLAGAPLRSLEADHTRVRDLRPLAGRPVTNLTLQGSPVDDLTPLRTLPLETLSADVRPERDRAVLLAIPTLRQVNGRPPAEVLGAPDP